MAKSTNGNSGWVRFMTQTALGAAVGVVVTTFLIEKRGRMKEGAGQAKLSPSANPSPPAEDDEYFDDDDY